MRLATCATTHFGIGAWKANWLTFPRRGSPAGGGHGTTRDLIRCARALRQGKLVSETTMKKLFDGAVLAGPDRAYAAGIEDRLAAGKHLRGHGGGAPGMNAMLAVVWESGAAVAVASNQDAQAAEELATHIADQLAAQ